MYAYAVDGWAASSVCTFETKLSVENCTLYESTVPPVVGASQSNSTLIGVGFVKVRLVGAFGIPNVVTDTVALGELSPDVLIANNL